MMPPTPPLVLVTGATGTVGRPLVAALVAAGIAVRALVTDPNSAGSILDGAARGCHGQLAVVRFDFADPATFAEAFGGGEALFLLRPPAISDVASVINPAVDAAVSAGVRRVVFLSVQGAGHNPLVPHHAVERHLTRLTATRPAVSSTFLRAAFFMQNLSTTHAADIRELDEVFVPAGDGRTAFVDARDVAGAAALVLAAAPDDATHRNEAYELTGREALTYDEVAAVLTRVLGRPIVYRHPGALRFYRHMRARGLPRAYVGVMVALYTTARLGLADHLSPDLERLLGRAPIDFARFASEQADTWR